MFHYDYDMKISRKSLSVFYCHVLYSWKQLREQCNADKDVNEEILWNNT